MGLSINILKLKLVLLFLWPWNAVAKLVDAVLSQLPFGDKQNFAPSEIRILAELWPKEIFVEEMLNVKILKNLAPAKNRFSAEMLREQDWPKFLRICTAIQIPGNSKNPYHLSHFLHHRQITRYYSHQLVASSFVSSSFEVFLTRIFLDEEMTDSQAKNLVKIRCSTFSDVMKHLTQVIISCDKCIVSALLNSFSASMKHLTQI